PFPPRRNELGGGVLFPVAFPAAVGIESPELVVEVDEVVPADRRSGPWLQQLERSRTFRGRDARPSQGIPLGPPEGSKVLAPAGGAFDLEQRLRGRTGLDPHPERPTGHPNGSAPGAPGLQGDLPPARRLHPLSPPRGSHRWKVRTGRAGGSFPACPVRSGWP